MTVHTDTAPRTAETGTADATVAAPSAAPASTAASTSTATSAPAAGSSGSASAARGRRSGDDYAVASFVTGLAGLLVFNLFLGPCALIFGALALARGTTRRARAWLGITLGIADLAVLAALTAVNGTLSWSMAV